MAELGFLDVYIGGASKFTSDPYYPVIILISKIPEWGALVAQGTPYLRGLPFMALGPAIAYFISILGLNAFGEGIRRIFDRWPLSMAFILKKRMLLVIAAFIGISALIFQMTNATVSYQKLAESFNADSVVARYEEMKIYNHISPEPVENPLISYITEKITEYDIQRGYSGTVGATYYYPAETTLVKPVAEPVFRVGSRSDFYYLNEFSFLAEGCAGSGYGTGQIILINAAISDLPNDQRKELRGKIILTWEELYNLDFAQAAALQGAEGILVVTQQQPPLKSQFEVSGDPNEDHCLVDEIPVYLITNSVAKRIAAQANQDWDVIMFQPLEEKSAKIMDLRAVLDLQLSEPTTVSVPNMIGFIGGYDMDHADEIMVIYTSFDGLGLSEYHQERVPDDDLAKIAVLLEIMRTWQDHNLDPRRSVQFVIWGGEGIEGPYNDLLYSLFEKNKLSAKVPSRSVKPALWVEIGDLSFYPATMVYSEESSDFMIDIFQQAGKATDIQFEKVITKNRLVNIDLPGIYIYEIRDGTHTAVLDINLFIQKGIVINRALIQLVRDMNN
jgi:hypothetical protein